MKLQMIPMTELKIAPVNMRKGRKKLDVSDILPSIREVGVLQSLLVRPNCEGYEILAGGRRFTAATEAGLDALPCLVGDFPDDADAIEASLIENTQRLDPDAMTQFEAFAKLAKEGRSIEEIASRFLIPEQKVRQRLAIAKLIPAIRTMIRDDDLNHSEIQMLTMASTAKQKEFVALAKEGNAPRYNGLKAWLFAQGQIRTDRAIFDVAEYTGETISDLFGDCEYFFDVEQFWTLQYQAIETTVDDLTAKGWAAVHVLEIGDYFDQWRFAETTKKDGGHVYIEVKNDGAVEVHKGLLTHTQANRVSNGEEAGETTTEDENKPERAEISEAMRNYMDLHRAAAVQRALATDPKTALRYAVAVLMAGNGSVHVNRDEIRPKNDAIAESVANSPAAQTFQEKKSEAWELLGLEQQTFSRWSDDAALTIFEKLLDLSDAKVIKIMAVAIADQVKVGSGSVDVLGEQMDVSLSNDWQADDTFYEMLRDKRTIGAMLGEIAGKSVQSANPSATGKTMKEIMNDALTGQNGREMVTGWVPRYLAFPASHYVSAVGLSSQYAAKEARKLFDPTRV